MNSSLGVFLCDDVIHVNCCHFVEIPIQRVPNVKEQIKIIRANKHPLNLHENTVVLQSHPILTALPPLKHYVYLTTFPLTH